ncbi:MAG TPA: 50S ribosomal protein L23 [Oceanospirillales bacterium]|nr:50S ribosomal protein L23 [Oceanospirillales bacterium]
MSLNNLYTTVLSPIISEKSNRIGEQSNQYVFQVAVSSNKKEVKAAVEKLFEVKVEDVKILNVKGKTKSFKGKQGSRPGWKKAYVRVQEGQLIDFGVAE